MTLAEAERGARAWGAFALVPPTALPAGARLVRIVETAPRTPMMVVFLYQTPAGGRFEIEEMKQQPPAVASCPGGCPDPPHWTQGGTGMTLQNFAPAALTPQEERAIRIATGGTAVAGPGGGN